MGKDELQLGVPLSFKERQVYRPPTMGHRGKRRKQLFRLKWNGVGSKEEGPLELGREGCIVYRLQR